MAQAREAAATRQRALTKPPGSLGRLEALAVQLAAWQGVERPAARPAAALLFAADHPVQSHGVSPYPSAVTAAMLRNFVTGGAAASVAARHLEVPLHVWDVGVATPVPQARRHPVADAPGAGDLRAGRAMTPALARAAREAGREAFAAIEPAPRVLVLGEMGIGNSTVAAALVAALLELPAAEAVGPGTWADAAGLARKREVVEDALGRLEDRAPKAVLASLGGREIAALVGAMEAALERRVTVLVDGYIVSAAALALRRLRPGLEPGLVFGHRSAEPGHAAVLADFGARPLLDLGLRLGEGSGALAAYPLVELACALHAGMATFAEAGVPERQA